MKAKVLIAAPVHPVLTEGLAAMGYELIVHHPISREEAKAVIKDCVGVVTSNALVLNKEMIEAAPMLRWIGRMGSGMEVIDVPFAKQRNIVCVNSPEGNCNAVAEHAVGLLLSVIRNIHSSANEVAAGKWLREENRGWELEGKTIGIIGMGHTGSAFAKKLSGFEINILGYDTNNELQNIPANVHMCKNINEIYEQADIVSFHVPIKEDTIGYLDAKFLLKMTKAFVLINTSRGEVVDTEVLLHGLTSGKIIGAGIDVWPEEPLAKMGTKQRHILEHIVAQGNTIVTPHIAGYTYEAAYKMSMVLLGKIGEIKR